MSPHGFVAIAETDPLHALPPRGRQRIETRTAWVTRLLLGVHRLHHGHASGQLKERTERAAIGQEVVDAGLHCCRRLMEQRICRHLVPARTGPNSQRRRE